MRLVHAPDGSVDRYDRALWMTLPFDLLFQPPPDVPGLEFTLPENRCHFTLPNNRAHFVIPENRCHFTLPDTDQD